MCGTCPIWFFSVILGAAGWLACGVPALMGDAVDFFDRGALACPTQNKIQFPRLPSLPDEEEDDESHGEAAIWHGAKALGNEFWERCGTSVSFQISCDARSTELRGHGRRGLRRAFLATCQTSSCPRWRQRAEVWWAGQRQVAHIQGMSLPVVVRTVVPLWLKDKFKCQRRVVDVQVQPPLLVFVTCCGSHSAPRVQFPK